jgi:hypothetical protein
MHGSLDSEKTLLWHLSPFGSFVRPAHWSMDDMVWSVCAYAMLTADPIKDMPNETIGWAIPVSCLLCEGDTVVCEDGMNGVWVDRHNFLKKCSSILLGRRIKERHVGKFGDTINGQKHVLLAFLQT